MRKNGDLFENNSSNNTKNILNEIDPLEYNTKK